MINYYKQNVSDIIINVVSTIFLFILYFYNNYLNQLINKYKTLYEQAIFAAKQQHFWFMVLLSIIIVAALVSLTFIKMKNIVLEFRCYFNENITVDYYNLLDTLLKIIIIIVMFILLTNPILKLLFTILFLFFAFISLLSA